MALFVQTCNSQNQTDITEISLKTSPCFGTCPVFDITIQTDGNAKYIGKRFTKLQGEFQATIGKDSLIHLYNLLRKADVFSLESRYEVSYTDMPTYTLNVKNKEGKSKTISDYGPSGPQPLKEVYKEISKLIRETKWQEVPGSTSDTKSNIR